MANASQPAQEPEKKILGITSKTAPIYISIISLFVSVSGVFVSYHNQSIPKIANDRVSGRIMPKFRFVSFHPPQDSIDKEFARIRGAGKGQGNTVTPNTIRLLNMFVKVQNIGDEAIDAFRVETKTTEVSVVMANDDKNKFASPFQTWRIGQSDSDEFKPPQVLSPGKIATIRLGKGIVSQVMKAPVAGNGKKEQFSVIEIRVFAKLFGVENAYGPEERGDSARIRINWLPDDYTKEAWTKFLNEYDTKVEIEDSQRGILPPLERVDKRAKSGK
jgi:hypothetical protein